MSPYTPDTLVIYSSFFWGIFMFDEKVKNFRETLVSLTILIAGLVGMSVYASPAPRKQDQRHKLLHRHTTTSSSRGTTTSTPELSFEENDTAMITRSNVDDHDDERVTVDSLKSVSSKVLMSADTKVGPLSNRASTSIVRTRKKVADNKKGFSSLATTAVDRNITQYWDVECTRLVKKGYPPAQKKDIILRFLGGRVCLSTRQLGKKKILWTTDRCLYTSRFMSFSRPLTLLLVDTSCYRMRSASLMPVHLLVLLLYHHVFQTRDNGCNIQWYLGKLQVHSNALHRVRMNNIVIYVSSCFLILETHCC
jgi:hypothetical protein